MREHIPLFVSMIAAAAGGLICGPWLRRIAWRVGMLDRPKVRGVHGDTVARSGGMTIVASLMIGLLAQMLTAQALGVSEGYLSNLEHVYLLLPALGIFGIGALDDIRGLPALGKLGVQAIAALWVWALGFRLDALSFMGLVEVNTGWLSLPMTVLFVVALTNAFNLIDGIDGLCGGVSFIALAGVGMYRLIGGQVELTLALPLAAACAAFIRLNFGRPRCFLGDSGSMFLGFIVSALSLRAVRTPAQAVDVVPLFLLLSLPIIDVTTVFFRRILQGRSPMRADRGHIHHIALLIFDGSAPRATATLLTMALVAAFGSIVAGAEPSFAAAALAVPCGLFATIYALGGYLNPRSLWHAGPVTDAAELLATKAQREGPEPSLRDASMLDIMKRLELHGLELVDTQGLRQFALGECGKHYLQVPLYSGGRAQVGQLRIAADVALRSRLAFAAHLLLPLYPVFIDLLQRAEPAPLAAIVHQTTAPAARQGDIG
ncbi:MAG: undecaprenyl/decaprenyl-phosphate alpha-N-acetylglucosaminyl 1-phosphate transferase [Planctomycetes bacterium]|nr:undecaprenyl/decaprenyl-phosphate alpha-N-acetylglucosaminyl 1-phosphate transferase [Planctomycetota bacterium]